MILKLIYLLVVEVGFILFGWGLIIDGRIFQGSEVVALVAIFGSLAFFIVGCAVAMYRLIRGTAPQSVAPAALTELTVLRILSRRPVFFVPMLFTTILPAAFLAALFFAPGRIMPRPNVLVEPLLAFMDPLVLMALLTFAVVFVIVMLQTWGFLIAGELLQKQFMPGAHRMTGHMIKNTLFALPFAVVYSLVFVVAVLARGKESDRNNLSNALKSFSLFAILQTFKYYIYANLAALSFEDKYTYATLRDSLQYVRANAGRLLGVFVNSAMLTAGLILYFFVLVVWWERIPFLTKEAMVPVVMGLVVLITAWIVFVEQILFLLTFIGIRHPQLNVATLAESTEPPKVV